MDIAMLSTRNLVRISNSTGMILNLLQSPASSRPVGRKQARLHLRLCRISKLLIIQAFKLVIVGDGGTVKDGSSQDSQAVLAGFMKGIFMAASCFLSSWVVNEKCSTAF
ncbi:hypothetical protein OIU74_011183 [Salix koriyanagi]|uniref:Uncharacterized protein n=1 Tax=Salix koriyanagi TaxID=2511006 RepID=A0A9Q0YTZ2_9ROSI|nr:hypothetical protein OIU74_011183 [Salix koriyanagi]